MEATLIVNPNAGNTGRLGVPELLEALENAGYRPVHRATERESDLDEVLEHARGVIVAAGGDGTVRAVAKRLLDRDLPLAILPLGTANNIGRALGLTAPPLEIAANLNDCERRPFDVGRVEAPWGTDYFLEAVGCGIYADALAAYDPDEGKSVPRALSAVAGTLRTYVPLPLQVRLDGRDLSGEFLMLEALNTAATGPRLQLSPEASPSDGLLDVVIGGPERRDSVLSIISGLFLGGFDTLESVEIVRGRRLELSWIGQAFHVDGEVRPVHGPDERIVQKEGTLIIELLPSALTLLLPREVPS